MNSLWVKIRADLFEHPASMLLSVLSIAIGVFAVGTLFGMIDLQLSSMDAAHREAKPAHINLILQAPISKTSLARLSALPDVAALEPMNQLTVRFKTQADQPWRLGALVIRADFNAQSQDLMTKIAGEWPAATSIGVERLSMQVAGLKVGDRVILDTSEGEQVFPISGTIRHPFVKPPAFGGQVHFFANAETLALFGAPQGYFRQLLVTVSEPYSIAKARRVAESMRSTLSRESVGVNVAFLQNPEQHWGRPFVAGINRVLQVMALAALGLSTLLVLNTVTAQITQQTDQIGIMKSVGGSRGVIASLYLTEILALGCAASLLALPGSAAAAWVASQWLLNLFNIELSSFQLSWRALALVLAGGVLAPLLAAVWPIWRGASMTVREAMSSYGVGADFGSSRLDRWIEIIGAHLLPTLYAAALGNLFRRKSRLALTQLVLVTAGVMFLVIMSLMASVNLTLDREMARSSYDVRLGLTAEHPISQLDAIARNITGVTTVEYWSRSPAVISVQGQPLVYAASLGGQVVALPADSTVYRPLITGGRWLNPSDDLQQVIVLNAETAELNQIAVGDVIDLAFPGTAAKPWRVLGLYRWIAGSHYAVESSYAPLATVRTLTGRPESASQVLVSAAVNSLAEEQALADSLKTALETAGIKLDFYTTTSRQEQSQQIASQFRPVLATLLGLSSMIAAVGGVGLSGALTISVMQRRREIGVLRAIGAPFRSIFRLFVLEGVFQAGLAWFISVPVAFVLAAPLARELGQLMLHVDLDFQFNHNAVWIWLGLVLIIGLLAAFGPALNAARMTVRESLSHH